jgi:lipoprotein NlpI
MNRLSLAGLFILSTAAAAFGAAYDDFARGLAANNRGDSPTAIEAFTKAIDAADLAPSLKPVAYYGRASANLRAGHCKESLADTDSALALKPDYYDAIVVRGEADVCLGNYEAAFAIYSDLLSTRPSAGLYSARGWVRWRLGAYADAASDFAQAAKLQRRNSYFVVWMALLQARAGAVDAQQIDEALSNVSETDWPGPVIGLFVGRRNPAEVTAAAQRGDADGLKGRQCESDFYTGEWQLVQKDEVAAKDLFNKAASSCPREYVEYYASKFELERLK